MRIRKVTEPFKHLSGEPFKVVAVHDTKKFYSQPATVTHISKAAEYNRANKEAASCK